MKIERNPTNKVNVREKQFRNGALALAIGKGKCRMNFNKLIYIGASSLDLRKVLPQDFRYNYFKNKYGDEAEMLQTDTDSIISKLEELNMFMNMFSN